MGAASVAQPSQQTSFSLLSFLLSKHVSRKLAAAGHIFEERTSVNAFT